MVHKRHTNQLRQALAQAKKSVHRSLGSQKSQNSHPKLLHQGSEIRLDQPEVSGPMLVKQTITNNATRETSQKREIKILSRKVVAGKRYVLPSFRETVICVPAFGPPVAPVPVAPPAIIPVEIMSAETISVVAEPSAAAESIELGFCVHNWKDEFTGRRVWMPNIGLDIGTKTIVLAYRDADKINFISEINGYWPFDRSSKFIENLLDDNTKIRSDGKRRAARWIKLDDRVIVLGADAEEFAYAKNDTLHRPMAEGGISADEEAMTVLASIVHGLLEKAEHEIGHFTDELKICYCTTAPAINKDLNVDYHERVVNMIVDGYKTDAKMSRSAIKESHAIVLDMGEDVGHDGTGIGISWGAGTVTVSYVKYGMEIYSFSYIGAGDWIDEQVAMRHGYNPETRLRKKTAFETPTTVCKRKMDINLQPGNEPTDRVGLDITLHYDVLISRVIDGIINGFLENEAAARIDNAINVYMAGGTSSPAGFVERVIKKLDEKALPFEIGKVKRSARPLYSVAAGCLRAAELGLTDVS